MMKEEYNDDRELRQLFDNFRPKMADSKDFMEQLEKRMDAIEYVNRMQAKKKKHTHKAMLCAFAGGVAVGYTMYALFISSGNTMPSTTVETQFMLLRIIHENSRLLACTIFSTLSIVAIIMAASLWQEVAGMNDARKNYDSSDNHFSFQASTKSGN